MVRNPLLVLAMYFPMSCGGNSAPGDSSAEPSWTPDFYCPGSPGCEASPGAALEVGVAVRSVIPDCYESWEDSDDNSTYSPSTEAFLDCGCDRLCPEDANYPGPDSGEGDGQFQAIWMAGFQQSRPATGVRGAELGLRGEGDGLWAHAMVFHQGQTSLGLVSIDAMGWMHDDVLQLRADAVAAGLDLDHIIVHSTHDHEAPDSMGIYGPSLTTTGYDPSYASQTRAAALEALTEAHAERVSVQVEVGVARAADAHPDGVANLIRDSRDPWIVDDRVGAARFFDASGDTVATLVHFSNHPETVANNNTLLTSDYAHALRKTVSEGVDWGTSQRDGVGGTTVFVNGSVGGMMTSLGVSVESPDGAVRTEATFDKADAVGQILGELALDALDSAQVMADPELAFHGQSLFLPVDNQGFQAMFLLGVLDHRTTWNYEPDLPLDDQNTPEVRTEVNVVQIGPLQWLTIPGELLPELAIGGYDGSFTAPGVPLIDPDNPNPPQLDQAPQGPYLMDHMSGDTNWIVGLGNDEIGYIIPPYNFVLADAGAWILEAEGDHYEETNSLGADTYPRIEEVAAQLLSWQPPTP